MLRKKNEAGGYVATGKLESALMYNVFVKTSSMIDD